MASGILSLSGALKLLAQNANAATAEVERTVRVVDSIPDSDAVDGIRKAIDETEKSVLRLLGLRAGQTISGGRTTEAGADADAEEETRDRRNLTTHLVNTRSLLDELLSFRGDVLANETFDPSGQKTGSVTYAAAVQWMLDYIKGLEQNERAFRDPTRHRPTSAGGLENLANIFERFFGTRFGRLEDLAREMMKRTKEAQKQTLKNVKTSTSGTLGKPQQKSCGGESSLSILLQSGGLR